MARVHGAFIYARYSTDNQNQDSVEVQIDRCKSWCKDHNIPVLHAFFDEAVSGMKTSRPDYDRMMAQLKLQAADTVVVYDSSRMFRDMTAWLNVRRELSIMGVQVISVTQPMIGKDLRDPTNFLTEGSWALFNQLWVLQTRQKTMEKMRFMARNGQHTGGVPALGFKVENGVLVIDEKEAQIVRRIFKEYADGKSYKQIIDGLNADGIRTKKGNTFGSNSLHDLLKNEKYIGVVTYGASPYREDGTRNTHAKDGADVVRVEDVLPAIIDKDLFVAVQKRMERNKNVQRGRPAQVRDYPLKGKVFCGECKAAMTVSISSGSYYYYRCSGKKRKHQCTAAPIAIDELEKIVVDAVRSQLADPVNAKKLVSILREQAGEVQDRAVVTLNNLIAERASIVKKLDNATDAVLNGLYSASVGEKIKSLEQQLASIESQMKCLKNSVDATILPATRLEEIVNFCISNKNADPAALLSIVHRVEVYEDKVLIWTILDSDPTGNFDDSASELIINLGTTSGVPRIAINIRFLRILAERKRRL